MFLCLVVYHYNREVKAFRIIEKPSALSAGISGLQGFSLLTCAPHLSAAVTANFSLRRQQNYNCKVSLTTTIFTGLRWPCYFPIGLGCLVSKLIFCKKNYVTVKPQQPTSTGNKAVCHPLTRASSIKSWYLAFFIW